MEVAVSIIYYIPYNGINLNWTAIIGDNGILMKFFQITWNFDGNLLELFRLLLKLRFYAKILLHRHAVSISRPINRCTQTKAK